MAARLGRRLRLDVLLDDDIDRTAGHDQMLDAVAVDQHELPTAIDHDRLAEADAPFARRAKEAAVAIPENVAPENPGARPQERQDEDDDQQPFEHLKFPIHQRSPRSARQKVGQPLPIRRGITGALDRSPPPHLSRVGARLQKCS